MRNANMTMNPTSFEVVAACAGIGVRFNIHQGYSNMLDSITFPISGEDARSLSEMLIGRSGAVH